MTGCERFLEQTSKTHSKTQTSEPIELESLGCSDFEENLTSIKT